jgi:hypothetical protein
MEIVSKQTEQPSSQVHDEHTASQSDGPCGIYALFMLFTILVGGILAWVLLYRWILTLL